MKILPIALLTLLAGCATSPSPSWQQNYPAPYNTATSEEQARIWKKRDEVFKDRADFTEQGMFEGKRIYPKPIAQPGPRIATELEKEQGIVLVAYLIERDGSVIDARIIESNNPKLDLAAINAVKRWRFRPGTVAGEPRIWSYTQEFEFVGADNSVPVLRLP